MEGWTKWWIGAGACRGAVRPVSAGSPAASLACAVLLAVLSACGGEETKPSTTGDSAAVDGSGNDAAGDGAADTSTTDTATDDAATDDAATDDAVTDDAVTDDAVTGDAATDDAATGDAATDDAATDDAATDDAATNDAVTQDTAKEDTAVQDTAPTCTPTNPAKEICDGIDNDCDGKTDDVANICDDGNACTDDVCKGAAKCSTTDISGGCSDGDACTSNDGCKDGSCSGAAMVCDDGLPCTLDGCKDGSCSAAPIPDCVTCTQDSQCVDVTACTVDSCKAGICNFAMKTGCQDIAVIELVATPATVDVSAGPATVVFTYTQVNYGSVAPKSANWYMPHLAPQNDISTANVSLVCSNSKSYGAAAPGKPVKLESSCTIQQDPKGLQYVFLKPMLLKDDADPTNDVAKPATIQINYVPKPDLQPQASWANTPSGLRSVKKQEQSSLPIIVQNLGDLDAPKSKSEVWLSWKDEVIGNDKDIKIGTIEVPVVAAGKSWTLSPAQKFYMDPIMWGWSGGWYVCHAADTGGSVVEKNEANNVKCVKLLLVL